MHQSQIIQHLFQVSSLEDVSRERLEAFVEEHPSFGIGHYLLSRKLQKEGGDGFEVKTQLTSLYFSNPFWLQWLLDNTDVGGKVVAAREMETPERHTPEQHIPEQHTSEHLTLEHLTPEPEPIPYTTIEAGPPAEQEQSPEREQSSEQEQRTVREQSSEQEQRSEQEQHVEENVPAQIPPVENVVTMAEEAFYEENTTVQASPVHAAPETAAEQLLRNIGQARELRESLLKLNTDYTDEPPMAEAVVPAESVVEAEPAVAAEPTVPESIVPEPTPAVEPVPSEAPIRDEEVPFVLDEKEDPTPQPAPVPQETPTTPQRPVTQETPASAPPIAFEPYHTIDYFASQGIKFTLEENPPDKLGKQLKSFTDWLKVMRRLPQKDKEVIPDRVAEQAIQTIAAHSIEGREVLTEAMAEVLAKQGMRERARIVYEKLSLLNPEKSAYFAAKIEQLNIL